MKLSFQQSLMSLLTLALAICLSASVAPAQRKTGGTRSVAVKDTKRANDAARHSQDASQVFKEIMGTPDKAIPKELLDKAEAVAVFPGITKAGFIVGGRGGQGVISRRLPGGWSAPAFFNLGGADFGAQIGVQKIDAVLLFMNDDAVGGLLKDKVELGGEVGATAGPVGRNASASTDALARAGILSYSRSKGLFIGAVIKGAAITPDNDLNQAVYGMDAKDLLTGGRKLTMAQYPSVVRVFPLTLSRYSRK